MTGRARPPASPGGGCNTDPAISAGYKAPNTREVWIEVAHKFRKDWYPLGPGCAAGGYKFLLLWRDTDRFDIINFVNGKSWWSSSPQSPVFSGYSKCSTAGPGENCRWGYGKGQSTYLASAAGMHWDSQWHIYRVHLRIPSTKGNTDGTYEIWVDGVKTLARYNRTFISNDSRAFMNTSPQLRSDRTRIAVHYTRPRLGGGT